MDVAVTRVRVAARTYSTLAASRLAHHAVAVTGCRQRRMLLAVHAIQRLVVPAFPAAGHCASSGVGVGYCECTHSLVAQACMACARANPRRLGGTPRRLVPQV